MSIFRLDLKTCPPISKVSGQNGMKNLRTLRHPHVLACLDSVQLETEYVIATGGWDRCSDRPDKALVPSAAGLPLPLSVSVSLPLSIRPPLCGFLPKSPLRVFQSYLPVLCAVYHVSRYYCLSLVLRGCRGSTCARSLASDTRTVIHSSIHPSLADETNEACFLRRRPALRC